MADNSKVTDEAQIRKLITDRAKAMQTKDINVLMASYSPNVIEYDAVNTLQYSGINEARKRAESWFGAYNGGIGYETRDMKITTSSDVAFCHFLYCVSGTLNSGGAVNMWVRDTVCFQKIEGNWVVTHEHTSVPFEAESGKASLALQP